MQKAGAGALAAAWDEAYPGRGTAWPYEQSGGWGQASTHMSSPYSRGRGSPERGVWSPHSKGRGRGLRGPEWAPLGGAPGELVPRRADAR